MYKPYWVLITVLLLTRFFSLHSVHGDDWPTFRRDFGRSGYINVDFDPGNLQLKWNWQSTVPPEPAWDGPARWDAFAGLKDLPAMRQYDSCFQPVSDGQTVFIGSSSQNSIFAIDIQTGKSSWSFVAGGPVRIAPTIHKSDLLFGSDDGSVYCLNKNNGELKWKFNASQLAQAEQRLVLNNDRLISFYPIRTGVVVRDNTAYFAASFLPWRESFLCGINLKTGQPDDSPNTFISRHENLTLEGPMLVAGNRLIVPQGRIAPLIFDRTNGKQLASLPGGGGVTIVLTEQGDVARAEGGRAARAGQVGVFRGKERVASFPRGRAIVVREQAFYVLDQNTVFAASRKANELIWKHELTEPLEIIMVGSYLVIGCRDSIVVLDSETGKKTWQTSVNGRVFGLAFSRGTLLAATDTGQLMAFQSTSPSKWKPEKTALSTQRSLPDVPKANESGPQPVHRWVFHRAVMTDPSKTKPKSDELDRVIVKDLAGKVDLMLNGKATSTPVGKSKAVECIELQGGAFPIPETMAANLPAKNLTLESWVRVDRTATWGGIIGCIQDDGSTEHGWILGYNGDRFSLAVAGTKSGLTYLKADRSFRPGDWHHVVGTYDGSKMSLYVDGQLAASSSRESGPISYAAKRFFTVGAYRDTNEFYPLAGGLHEVRVYESVLSPQQIQTNYVRLKSEFPKATGNGSLAVDSPLKAGPFVRFVAPRTARISFETRRDCQPVLEIENPDGSLRQIPATQHGTFFDMTVDGLPFKRQLSYRLKNVDPGGKQQTAKYSLDTHFNWSQFTPRIKKPHPVLDQLPNPRGMALVLGKQNIDLAAKLVEDSNLTVILLLDDEAVAAQVRQNWIKQKSLRYGQRISVLNCPLERLPGAFAQLVIASGKEDSIGQQAIRRLVRPYGGILSDGKKVIWKRSSLSGAGEWTHMYGLPDNSAYGGESLGQASNREDLVANWIGRPGPRYQTDRQNRKPSPLASNGRLYLQGHQRLIALDSFSGSILWSVETPTVMRWNIPRDSSNWCADEEGVFVAAEAEAWLIDGATGKIKKRYPVPPFPGKKPAADSGSTESKYSWGYIARHEEFLLGTKVQTDAIYTKWWGKTQWFDTPTGGDTHAVAGDTLFAIDKKEGKLQWSYHGLVLHPTITILDGRIYFIEDKTEKHIASSSRRISIDKEQVHELVCLNPKNGEEIFRQPVSPFEGKISALYLAGGGGEKVRSLVIAASEATRGQFKVTCLDPSNGNQKWSRAVKWETNHHGKHISRPAIENELVYLRPEVLLLSDGSTKKRGFPSGHGCSSYTLSKNGLFSRLGETTWWDVRNDKVNRFTRVRTDCWISAIPAQGMLLSAEGGGGCSCGSWLETSIGFLPRSHDQSVAPTDD